MMSDMTEQADIAHLTLALLRKVDQRTERMAEDMKNLKLRMSSVEANLAQVDRRMDRFEERLERIERRLELSGAPVA